MSSMARQLDAAERSAGTTTLHMSFRKSIQLIRFDLLALIEAQWQRDHHKSQRSIVGSNSDARLAYVKYIFFICNCLTDLQYNNRSSDSAFVDVDDNDDAYATTLVIFLLLFE